MSTEKKESYRNSEIHAFVEIFEVFNPKKNKFEYKKNIVCHLYRPNSIYQPLNLGECNDGSKFTSINQAVNQAKDFVNCCIKYNW